MSHTFSILNLEALQKATLQKEPFPYLIVDNILQVENMQSVMDTFPVLKRRGSFPPSALSISGHFATLIQELQHPLLREMIGRILNMDLEDRPPVITVRGYTTERDGHIHVDSKSKLVTVLLYLNSNWESPKGCLRLLHNNHDLNHYFAEIPPKAGRCLIFKVTPNGWHGHEVFIGERRAIQLNYVTSEAAVNRHLKRHRISAFLKKLFFRISDEAY